MLDSSRNFFSKAYVKKFIDRLAQHKINVFHWHLTDDEGWRIEIKKYPLLTAVGARRGPGTKLPFSLYPAMRGPKEKLQEGCYSQNDIREIVAYAQKRSVHILPEIDIPGHAKAAVTAYPALLQDQGDKSRYTSVQKIGKQHHRRRAAEQLSFSRMRSSRRSPHFFPSATFTSAAMRSPKGHGADHLQSPN